MRMSIVKAVSREDVWQAVHAARALVHLAETADDLEQQVAERDHTIERMRGHAEAAEKTRMGHVDRERRVRNLHAEAVEAGCADGCCHEELGHCEFDREPYPCATIRALDGEEAE